MEYLESDVLKERYLRVTRTFLSSRLAEQVQKKAYAYLVPSGKGLASQNLRQDEKESIITSVWTT
jgi:hypothetical protein